MVMLVLCGLASMVPLPSSLMAGHQMKANRVALSFWGSGRNGIEGFLLDRAQGTSCVRVEWSTAKEPGTHERPSQRVSESSQSL